MGFVGVARATWLFARDPKDKAGTRYMVPVKGNLAAQQNGLSYMIKESENAVPVKDPMTGKTVQIHPPRMYWGQPTDRAADEIMKPPGNQKASEIPAAKIWWQTLFAEKAKDGILSIKDFKVARAETSFSQYTIDAAKQELGIDWDYSKRGYIQLVSPNPTVGFEPPKTQT